MINYGPFTNYGPTGLANYGPFTNYPRQQQPKSAPSVPAKPPLPTYNYQAPNQGARYSGPSYDQFLSSPMSTGTFNQSYVGGLPQGDYDQMMAGTSPLQTGQAINDYMANQSPPEQPQQGLFGSFDPTMMGFNMLMNNGQDYNPTPMDIMGLFSGKM